MKKLTNIWSSRGLSIYGKVTIIKSLLIPKLVYVSSLLRTPLKTIKQVNHIIFTFLWKGKDKVTRLSPINTLEEGGIKMIDIGSMIKALRLAWLKRIFNNNDSTWKFYLIHVLKKIGDLLIFECNYAIKDLPTISTFYRELLIWWSEFRDLFFEEKYWLSIIWNNKDIKINGKPVFYKTYYNSGICTVNDLLFNLNNIDSFELIKEKKRANFLTWTSLRHSIPSNLKTAEYSFDRCLPYFKCKNAIFDISKNKSKDFYSLIVSRKAQLPNNAKKLTQSFNLTEEELKLVFTLPHKIVYEPYVKAFQYKILNSILYTNKKLFKVGYSEHDRCTFCDNGLETLDHLFFYCCFSNIFWTHFEKYYFTLTKKSRVLSNQDIIIIRHYNFALPLTELFNING